MDSIKSLGKVPEVAMNFVKQQYCLYPYFMPLKQIQNCDGYERCKNCGGCIYEEK